MTAYLVMVSYFYRIWRLWTTSTYPDIMSIGTQYCTDSHTIVTFKYISNQEGRDIGLLRLSTSIGPGETVFFRWLSSSIIKLTITIVVKIMKYSRMTYEELLANTSWGSKPASSLSSKSFRSESRPTRVSRSPLWRRWTEATVWTLKQNRNAFLWSPSSPTTISGASLNIKPTRIKRRRWGIRRTRWWSAMMWKETMRNMKFRWK